MLPVCRCPRSPDGVGKSLWVGVTGTCKSVAELESSGWTAMGLSLCPARPTLPPTRLSKGTSLTENLTFHGSYVDWHRASLSFISPHHLRSSETSQSPARVHCQPLRRGEEGWVPIAPSDAITDRPSHWRVLWFPERHVSWCACQEDWDWSIKTSI